MTAAEFVAVFPKFEQVDAAEITRWITRSAALMDAGRWDNLYVEGLGYLVAHSLLEEGVRGVPEVARGMGGGAVQSWRSDVYMLEADPLMGTSYGRAYLRLRKEVGKGWVSV